MSSRMTAAKKRPKKPAPPVPALAPTPEVRGAVPLKRIAPCPFNVRRHFDPTDIAELAANIRATRLNEALQVRPVPLTATFDGAAWHGLGHFELADGERRYRALKLIDETHEVESVPVVVRWLSDDEVRAVMLASREQSRDLAASELVAGYAELARDKTAEQVAALVGRPAAHVRAVLRLARLPAWALAAVDRGDLPRATAGLVARVPGEEGRKRAAACVLLGLNAPAGLADTWNGDEDWEEAVANETNTEEPLSYRDARDLIQTYFTRELKGAPFSRKSLTLLPAAGSCDACPKRAGNDPEAVADGTRADTCLDPDCYRAKVEAHDAAELLQGTRNGAKPAPDDFSWGLVGREQPPKGWCDVRAVGVDTELAGELSARQRGEKLLDLLGTDPHALESGRPIHAVLDSRHKLRLLMRTTDARSSLVKSGKLKKPEKRVPLGEEIVTLTGTPAVTDPRPLLTDEYEVDERAAAIAARVLGEYAEGRIAPLGPASLDPGGMTEAVRWLVRYLIRDHHQFGPERRCHVAAALGTDDEREAVAAAEKLTPRQLFGLAVRLAAAPVLEAEGGAKTGLAAEILEWAELDWPQLREQARRELAPGEGPTAEGEDMGPEKADPCPAEPEQADTPRWMDLNGGLIAALHSVEGAIDRWTKLLLNGATDAEIKAQAGREFGISGGKGGPGTTPVAYKGGAGPCFWWDSRTPTGKPTLAGKALIDRVREVLHIPRPAADPEAPKSKRKAVS